jgi:hypothetical protein
MQQNLTSCQPLPLVLERQIVVRKCKDLAGKRLIASKTWFFKDKVLKCLCFHTSKGRIDSGHSLGTESEQAS